MNDDPFVELKNRQRKMWASFAPAATFTTPVAGHLVKFAQIISGEAVLDVGTGTGVVAITAARAGATVTALDLTPTLLEVARENALTAHQIITWTEGDAEHLPYPADSFDVVLSQFGHIFAPRPAVVMAEISRVLKTGWSHRVCNVAARAFRWAHVFVCWPQFTATAAGRIDACGMGQPGYHRGAFGTGFWNALLRTRSHAGARHQHPSLPWFHGTFRRATPGAGRQLGRRTGQIGRTQSRVRRSGCSLFHRQPSSAGLPTDRRA